MDRIFHRRNFDMDINHESNGLFPRHPQPPDRIGIKEEWIERVFSTPQYEELQPDARIRRWAPIDEMGGRMLRVVLLPDGQTVHIAFFDRSFKP